MEMFQPLFPPLFGSWNRNFQDHTGRVHSGLEVQEISRPCKEFGKCGVVRESEGCSSQILTACTLRTLAQDRTGYS